MSNAIYPKYKESQLLGTQAALNGSGVTGVYCALVDTNTYTYDAAHQYYSSLSGIVGTDQEIGATKTYTNGVFDGADCVFPSVSGASAEALVIYVKNAGANTTWQLVAYIDTGVTGLPVTPNSGNINITWDASGIFAL
jgi:hypothetical protein